jgi:hypothetical protein
MLTPAGKECRYFYGDYHRGREYEECRLLKKTTFKWHPYLCEKCPVPDIVQANACEYMQFHPRLTRQFLLMRPQIKINATCSKCDCEVKEPKVGCGECHPLLDAFVVGSDESDSTD